MTNKKYILVLLLLSLLTHFMFFGNPSETVFDEVHFGKFISGYYTHEYFFDIHPPLGKMIIAGFAGLFDFQPEFAFSEIGDKFPDNQYMVLRFLPSLAGVLLSLIIFLLLIELKVKPKFAFLGGILIILENSILTQSLYILMDPFLLLFGFTSLLYYFKLKNYYTKYLILNTKYLLVIGIFGALATSVKWTGLAFLALPVVIEGVRYILKKDFKTLSKLFIYLGLIPIIIYFSFFAIHFSLLNKSGPGDAFMTEKFQRSLSGSAFENTKGPTSGIFMKFTELNIEMYRSNQRLQNPHPYSSAWYSWPLMTRPIYYWVNDNARIYFIGNPIIWWSSTIAVLVMILLLVRNLFIRNTKYKIQNTLLILLGAYFINILPFIGVKRVMFMYHYMPALILAIIILTYLLDKLKNPKKIVTTLLVASIVSFIFFAPLNYGLNLSPEQYESRVWFNSWR